MNEEAALVVTTQPCLLLRTEKGAIRDCHLIIEKEVVTKCDVKHALFVLFSSFYVFNVNYPIGCCNFYLLFECIFLRKKIVGRKPRIITLLADLSIS